MRRCVKPSVAAAWCARESAECDARTRYLFLQTCESRSLNLLTRLAFALAATFRPNSDPYLCRSAHSHSRPTTVSCRQGHEMRYAIGYHGVLRIALQRVRTIWGAQSKIMIGLRLCKRHQSSSQQLQYSVWQAALTMTSSVASLAQQAASWLLKSSAQIVPAPWLSAQPLACCATTQASKPAAKTKTCAPSGRFMKNTPSSGFPLGGGFAF